MDTNILQALCWLGEWIWDGSDDILRSAKFMNAGEEAQTDFIALVHLFGLRDGFPFETVVSARSLQELQATPNPLKRDELLTYGSRLYQWATQAFPPEEPTDAEIGLGTGIQKYLPELPDEFDKQLIGEAITKGCDVFLTLDRRTIRDRVGAVDRLAKWTGLRVIRPTELWEHFRPWTGFFT